MLKEAAGIKKVVLASGRTDMRMGINGLVKRITLIFGMDPLEDGTLYLFCGRRRDRIKGLLYDGGDGFVLITKRLTDGVYHWPRNTDQPMTLDLAEYHRLLDGYTITSSIHKDTSEAS